MTENSLGKMWLDGHKNSKLKQSLKYFVEEAEQTDEVKSKLAEINKQYAEKRVTDITFIDPCCGSGHILVYAFDLFYKMYLESGYVSNEIPSMILKNNIFGIDIDKRAAQLTSFALTMKALSYDKEFLTKHIYPNVIDIKESNPLNVNDIKEFFGVARLSNNDEEVVEEIVEKFRDAELYGSLIKDFRYTPERYDVVLKYIQNNVDPDAIFNLVDRVAIINTKPLICDLLYQAVILSSKYDVVATNPPYMPTSNNDKLKEFALSFYPDSKTDLFAMFMEIGLLKKNGFLAMINMHSWMFLPSYKELRRKYLNSSSIISLLHLGKNAFEEINGEVVQTVTFIALNNRIENYLAYYDKLTDFNSQSKKEIAFLHPNKTDIYVKNQELFYKIVDTRICYWVSNATIFNFTKLKIKDYGEARQGMATGDNEKFLRYWSEVNFSEISFNNKSYEDFKQKQGRYAPFIKSNGYRRWYGNCYDIIKFNRENYNLLSSSGNCLPSRQYYFLDCVNWNSIGTDKLGGRVADFGGIFSNSAHAFFPNKDELLYCCGFLNSKVLENYVKILSPTINYNSGILREVPLLFDNNRNQIERVVKENVYMAKLDWNQYEISWDFEKNPLLPSDFGLNVNWNIGSQYISYKNVVNQRYDILKQNEEELNKMFIDIYGLNDELKADVADKDITVARIYDTKNEIPEEMKNNIYVRTKQDVVKDLISYIVGCAFGRYSPYKEGLIFAGGKFNYDQYMNITKSLEQPLVQKGLQNYAKSFMPSEENCILLTDNEYGDNKMINFVVDLVKLVYGPATLEENLKFIANALDEKSSDTPRNVIREYLANDFFKDHCKKYQNRPIYWQFDSGKNGGFRALMYLHRYDENTIPTARLSYLHDIQWKYEQEKDRLEKLIENSAITSEKAKARKELDLIDKQILECKTYDEVLNHAANMRISIDLDDGVKVNYQKFQKLDGDKDKNILSTYLKF